MSTDGTTAPESNGLESAVQSSRPADPAQVYSWRQAIWQGAVALLVVSVGVGVVWWMGKRLNQQSTRVDELQKTMTTDRQRSDQSIEKLRLSQEKADTAIPVINSALDDMKRSLQELTQFRESLEEELELVRQQASQQKSLEARSKSRRIDVLSEIEAIRVQLSELAKDKTKWEDNYVPLETNDSGRRIAADEETLLLAATRWERDRPDQTQLTSWEDQLAALAEPLEKPPSDNSTLWLIDDEHVAEIRKLKQAVDQAREDWREDRLVLDTLKERTKDRTPGRTLKDALEQLRAEAGMTRTAAIATAREQQLEAESQRLAELEQQRISAVTDISAQKGQNELAELRDELNEFVRQGEQAEKDREVKRARQALLREYQNDLPEIRSLLMPYIARGYAQPAPGWKFEMTTKQGPVSLSALYSSGLLDDDRRALNQLYFATTANRMNDRPLGSFPAQAIGARDGQRAIVKVQRARELLIKYGQLMVADKMLAH